MTYPIIPELYGIVARKLLDEIGEKSFYSGSFSFDYGSKECRFVASIVIYRSKECLPEGDADRIDDLVPVWWNSIHPTKRGNAPTISPFPSLRSTSSDSTPQDRTSHPERRLLRSFSEHIVLGFRYPLQRAVPFSVVVRKVERCSAIVGCGDSGIRPTRAYRNPPPPFGSAVPPGGA